MQTKRTASVHAWAEDEMSRLHLMPRGSWHAIAGEASSRVFHRRALATSDYSSLEPEITSVIAMDAPPATEDNPRFVKLASYFRRAGIGVPGILAKDLVQGFLLVEDLGVNSYENAYRGADRDIAIDAALQTLVLIQQLPDDPLIPPYTQERFADELGLFRTWLLEGWLGLSLTSDETERLDALTDRLLVVVDSQPRVCVHRDYHCRNLIWRADHSTGVVDFQDALRGPASYDLASLLRDCYVRFDESEIDRWRNRYLALASDAGVFQESEVRFRDWLDLTALQRQLKALGIFARLKLRDGRASHLKDIGPVLDHAISIAARFPELTEFAQWLRERVAPATRLPR